MFDKGKQIGSLNNNLPGAGITSLDGMQQTKYPTVDPSPLTQVRQASLADTTGGLWTMKNINLNPAIPKSGQAFTVTGDIDLFNLKYYPFAWVVVTIGYPQQWWQLLGAQKTQTTQVANGSFKVVFPDGFDNEGDYTISVDVYGGPTMSVANLILPPFPAMAHYDTKFSVSGNIVDSTAFTLEAPTINGSAQSQDILTGSNVGLGFGVTSRSSDDALIQLTVEVREAGTALAAGPLLMSKNFDAVTVKPGDTAEFSLTYKDVGTVDKTRCIVEKLSMGSKLAPNTTPNNPYSFDDIYNITSAPAGASFVLNSPLINGSTAKKVYVTGSQISLSFPVKSTSTTPVAVSLKVEVREAGTALSAGKLLASKSFGSITVNPGDTPGFDMTYTDNGATDTDRSIVEALYVGTGSVLTPATTPNNPYSWNSIYSIAAKQAGLSFSFDTPKLVDYAHNQITQTTWNIGDQVWVQCGVTVKSTSPGGGKLTAGFRIRETSVIGTGDWLTDVIMSPAESYLNESSDYMYYTFAWNLAGAQGGKDAVFYIYVDDVEVAHQDISNFVQCIVPRYLTVIINPAGAGQVVDGQGKPFASNQQFQDGQTVTLNIPQQDQVNFQNWTGDLGSQSGWAAPYISITMDADKTVYANFSGAAPTPTPGGRVSYSLTPSNYPGGMFFWLVRHYDQNGNKDFESAAGQIAAMTISNVSANGTLEAWFADSYGSWSTSHIDSGLNGADGAAYYWDIGNDRISTNSPTPAKVSFIVMLTDYEDSGAAGWQLQWFYDDNGQTREVDTGAYDINGYRELSVGAVPAYGNVGVQLFDADGNSLGTHYSLKFQAEDGGFYNFDYERTTVS